MKGKEEVSERMLNKKETSQPSELVLKKLHELTQNYQNYRETTMNSLQTIST